MERHTSVSRIRKRGDIKFLATQYFLRWRNRHAFTLTVTPVSLLRSTASPSHTLVPLSYLMASLRVQAGRLTIRRRRRAVYCRPGWFFCSRSPVVSPGTTKQPHVLRRRKVYRGCSTLQRTTRNNERDSIICVQTKADIDCGMYCGSGPGSVPPLDPHLASDLQT